MSHIQITYTRARFFKIPFLKYDYIIYTSAFIYKPENAWKN